MARDLITLEEARDLLTIDKNQLDEVCLTHANIFDDVADTHAQAVGERDYAKDELSKVYAEIISDLRQDAAEKGNKVTEKGLEAAAHLEKDYIKANEAYLETKLEADRWSIKKDSFLQRSSMIKRLCDLHQSGYYTSRTVESVGERGEDMVAEKGRKGMSDKRKSRRARG
ncbi:MAG: hypothetical protein KAJ19_15830 [Gammaproteobacteria bacterium]|nr:hypothetical protein [Gammaproteobacteria bacterium]